MVAGIAECPRRSAHLTHRHGYISAQQIQDLGHVTQKLLNVANSFGEALG
jgi:hypothetical protein